MRHIEDEVILNAISNSLSMKEAAELANIPFNTFKRRAIKLGVYNTNQSGKGKPKKKK